MASGNSRGLAAHWLRSRRGSRFEEKETTMSFDEYEDAFVWKCNGCGLTVEFAPGNFRGCVDELKSRGWRFIRDHGDPEGGGWSHKCGRCSRKSEASMLDRPLRIAK